MSVAKLYKQTAVVRSQGVQDDEAGLLTGIIFRLTKRRLGRVPLAMRVRARDPKLFRNIVRMDLYAAFQGTVAVRLKELAQRKVAMMVGCPF